MKWGITIHQPCDHDPVATLADGSEFGPFPPFCWRFQQLCLFSPVLSCGVCPKNHPVQYASSFWNVPPSRKWSCLSQVLYKRLSSDGHQMVSSSIGKQALRYAGTISLTTIRCVFWSGMALSPERLVGPSHQLRWLGMVGIHGSGGRSFLGFKDAFPPPISGL